MRRLLGWLAVMSALAPVLAVAGATPVAASHPRQARAYVLGDSVLLGAKEEIPQALPGWSVTVNAFVGARVSPHGIERLREDIAAGRVGPLVVIHLGNNEWSPRDFRLGVDQVMRMLHGVADRVVMLNLDDFDELRPAFNAEIGLATTRWPRLEVADWKATVEATPHALYSDGVHLRTSGQWAMANLVAAHADRWLRQDDRCGPNRNPRATPSSRSARGYWMLDDHGRVHAYSAPHYGDLRTSGVSTRPVGMQSTPSGNGYWIVDEAGGVYAYGDARFHGSMAGRPLNGPVRRLEPVPGGRGYWLVGSDGGVFSFRAPFHGSTGAMRLNSPVIAMAANPRTGGYWLIAGDGGVFSFGTPFHGSTGGRRLSAPVISMAAHPRGHGYWLYAHDGGVFAFDVPFHGSIPGMGFCFPPTAVQLRPSDTGRGYWIVTWDGRVFVFGDARHYGSRPPLEPGARVIDLAVRHR